MNIVLVRGDIIEFKPGPSWRFDGFDGQVEVVPPDRGVTVEGQAVVIDQDLLSLAAELVRVGYKATGFHKVAGVVLEADLKINEATLSQSFTCDLKRVGCRSTTGTFTVKCQPSLSGSTPPIPDPGAFCHTGEWCVLVAQQNTVQAD